MPSLHLSGVSASVVVVLLALTALTSARITHLDVHRDTRSTIMIEPFGYDVGGDLMMNVTNFNIRFKEDVGEKPQMGFVMLKVDDVAAAVDELSMGCIEDHINPKTDIDFRMSKTKAGKWENLNFEHRVEGTGMYYLFFFVCEKFEDYSFNVRVTQYNPGKMFLSVGEAPLPFVYFVFFIVSVCMLVVWLINLRQNSTNVHKIHYLMAVLLVLKCGSLFFEALRFHQLKVQGLAPFLSTFYYLFAILKGIMLFTVILLIGTGWSIFKPFLADREKRILLIVIPMQVIANIGMVVIEETVPGSKDWMLWQNVLSIFDILCCCAVLFPIVWSIRALREAAERDGKAARNLEKLKQFRAFYIFVIAYIYMTRVILVVFFTYISYEWKWFAIFLTEFVTAVFYVVCGYRFRPIADNPYMKLSSSNDSLDGDVDLEDNAHSIQLKAVKKASKELTEDDMDAAELERQFNAGGADK